MPVTRCQTLSALRDDPHTCFRTSAAGAGATSGTLFLAATLRCALASFLLLFFTAAGLATFLVSGFLAGLFLGAMAEVVPASCLWRFERVGEEHCQLVWNTQRMR